MNTDTCYTHPGFRGHFRILSQRDGICTVIGSRGDENPGHKLFGVKRSDLRTCNCGRWRWPKKQEAKR